MKSRPIYILIIRLNETNLLPKDDGAFAIDTKYEWRVLWIYTKTYLGT